MKLYVGGLPYATSEQELIALFEQVGQVNDATIITDRDTGRSKGFGFVLMDNDAEAQNAIARLNGSMLGNRTLTVNEARERQPGGNRGYRNDRGDRGYNSNRGYNSDRRSNGGYHDSYDRY